MEEPEHQDQQAPKPKTRPGEGYTRRIQGKKKLTSVLLQEQLQATQAKLSDLLLQNELLRSKEAMQLDLLETAELGLQHMGAVAGSDTPQSVLSAALLDMQALKLKQTLFTGDSSAAAGPARTSRACAVTLEASDAAAAAADAPGLQPPACVPGLNPEPFTAATSSGSGSSGSGSGAGNTAVLLPWSGLGTPEDGAVVSNSSSSSSSNSSNLAKRLMASITPADMLHVQGLSVEELAGKFRSTMGRVALTRQAGSGVDQAVEEHGKLCMLSVISNEDRHFKMIGLNLESLQHVAPPDDMWAQVATTAKLQPQQVDHIRKAYLAYEQQQAQLLQRLQSTLCMLGSGPLDAARTIFRHVFAGSDDDATAAAAGSSGASALTAQQLQVLIDMCRNRAAGEGAGAGSSLVAGPEGMLTLERAEKAEELLQELSRIASVLRQHTRLLSTMFVNQLDLTQHADTIVAAYPFLLNCVAVCAQVAQLNSNKAETPSKPVRRRG